MHMSLTVAKPWLIAASLVVALGTGGIIAADAVILQTAPAAKEVAVISKNERPSDVQVTSAESTDENPSIFDLFFDYSMGLISDNEAKERLTASGITDFKSELEKSLKELKGDRVGLRQVTADQFSKLVRSMEIVSSGQQVEVIGVTKDRAYLEVSLFLTKESRYRAVVATKLVELPEAVLKKLK